MSQPVVGLRAPASLSMVPIVSAFALLASCSGGGGGATGTYTIDFPSDTALLATTTVDVDVFDASSAENVCVTLSSLAATQQALPSSLTSAARLDPCALGAGSGGAGSGALTVTPGWRAILIRASSRSGPYLVGCTRFDAAPGFNTTVTVSLLPGAAAPPSPTCASFTARCAGASC
jgi:hypothetical protein